MPVTRKQKRFMRMCASAKGRRKARQKCPRKSVAKEMANTPIKKRGK